MSINMPVDSAQGMVMDLIARGGDRYVDREVQRNIAQEVGKSRHYFGTGDSQERYFLSKGEEERETTARKLGSEVSDKITGSYNLSSSSGRLGSLANSGIDIGSALYLLSRQQSREYGSSCYHC